MAYPQAPMEMPLYMRLPQGYKCNGITRKTHALKLLRNVYGQKQAVRVWNKFMDQGMHEIRFTPSQFDPCLNYRGSVAFLVYLGFGSKTHQPGGFEGVDNPGAQLVGINQATTRNTLKIGKYT